MDAQCVGLADVIRPGMGRVWPINSRMTTVADHTQVWLAAIAIIPVTIASITSAMLAWRGNVQATRIGEMQRESTQVLLDVADKTHTLVNNNMQIQLEDYLSLAKRMAANEPSDINLREVERAEYRLKEHLTKQAKVDLDIKKEHGT